MLRYKNEPEACWNLWQNWAETVVLERKVKSLTDLANVGQLQAVSENPSLGKAQNRRGGQRRAELVGKEEDRCHFKKI